jgi:hypothetical protein
MSLAVTIESVRRAAIEAGVTDPEDFDAGIRDLRRTAAADGPFWHTFLRGVGPKSPRA